MTAEISLLSLNPPRPPPLHSRMCTGASSVITTQPGFFYLPRMSHGNHRCGVRWCVVKTLFFPFQKSKRRSNEFVGDKDINTVWKVPESQSGCVIYSHLKTSLSPPHQTHNLPGHTKKCNCVYDRRSPFVRHTVSTSTSTPSFLTHVHVHMRIGYHNPT